jgi:hypothetical protein
MSCRFTNRHPIRVRKDRTAQCRARSVLVTNETGVGKARVSAALPRKVVVGHDHDWFFDGSEPVAVTVMPARCATAMAALRVMAHRVRRGRGRCTAIQRGPTTAMATAQTYSP